MRYFIKKNNFRFAKENIRLGTNGRASVRCYRESRVPDRILWPQRGFAANINKPSVCDTSYGGLCFVLTKATPGYAGGEKELIARGGVDKKKSPS